MKNLLAVLIVPCIVCALVLGCYYAVSRYLLPDIYQSGNSSDDAIEQTAQRLTPVFDYAIKTSGENVAATQISLAAMSFGYSE